MSRVSHNSRWTLLVLPAISFLLAAGACSRGVTLTSQAGPIGVIYPPGVVIGKPCEGEIYFADGGGYVYCLDGLWEFTLDDPGSDDYSVDSSDASFVESLDSGGDVNDESDESGS